MQTDLGKNAVGFHSFAFHDLAVVCRTFHHTSLQKCAKIHTRTFYPVSCRREASSECALETTALRFPIRECACDLINSGHYWRRGFFAMQIDCLIGSFCLCKQQIILLCPVDLGTVRCDFLKRPSRLKLEPPSQNRIWEVSLEGIKRKEARRARKEHIYFFCVFPKFKVKSTPQATIFEVFEFGILSVVNPDCSVL